MAMWLLESMNEGSCSKVSKLILEKFLGKDLCISTVLSCRNSWFDSKELQQTLIKSAQST